MSRFRDTSTTFAEGRTSPSTSAQSYSILGISISPLLEISDPQSFCAAMLRLLEEWEQYADADKPGGLKMVGSQTRCSNDLKAHPDMRS